MEKTTLPSALHHAVIHRGLGLTNNYILRLYRKSGKGCQFECFPWPLHISQSPAGDDKDFPCLWRKLKFSIGTIARLSPSSHENNGDLILNYFTMWKAVSPNDARSR